MGSKLFNFIIWKKLKIINLGQKINRFFAEDKLIAQIQWQEFFLKVRSFLNLKPIKSYRQLKQLIQTYIYQFGYTPQIEKIKNRWGIETLKPHK